MTSIQAKFAVFFGKVAQKREAGWYWTSVPEPGEHLKGPFTGPFETKDEAIEHAAGSGAGRLHRAGIRLAARCRDAVRASPTRSGATDRVPFGAIASKMA